jgi:hypothetical protein
MGSVTRDHSTAAPTWVIAAASMKPAAVSPPAVLDVVTFTSVDDAAAADALRPA